MARAIDGELLELEIANIANKLAKSDAQKALMGRVMYCVEHMPTLTPQNEPLTQADLDSMDYDKVWIDYGDDGEWALVVNGRIYCLAVLHQYTRAELESITQETAIYIEGAGIAQLQWGGLEIAEGCRDGYLYCKHIKPFSLELYGQYWTAWDGPPERGKNNENPSGI